MKKFIIATALGATVLAGGAFAAVQDTGAAQTHPKRGMRADTDNNGVVTKAEALAQAEARFAKVDANNDGQITREERKAFRADKPRRGWGKRGGHGRGKMRAHMMERFDADKDGKLSETERAAMKQQRQAMHAQMLERFDADKDGKLSQAERQAARAAMKEMRGKMRAAPTQTAD